MDLILGKEMKEDGQMGETMVMGERIFVGRYEARGGGLVIGDYRGRICMCDWEAGARHEANLRRIERGLGTECRDGSTGLIELAKRELDEYFADRKLSEYVERERNEFAVKQHDDFLERELGDFADRESDDFAVRGMCGLGGRRRVFDLPLLFVGTEFQKRVWEELRRISYGVTVSYGELARRIGEPRAVRAVANANGANAISLFAPCHRVIGMDGSLTGYAGGLQAKRFLLDLERADRGLF